MSRSLFIVLEGVEGAGKSTQVRLLSEWFESLGLEHLVVREPGGTPVGEAIRAVVLDRGGLTMPPETELFLMLGARAAFVRDIVRPALEEGQIVLADRFDLSTFAYQGYGRGLDLQKVSQANAVATGGLVPDLYLVLDVPVDQGMARKGGPDGRDRIEKEGPEFLERVREGYRALTGTMDNARMVPAQDDPGEIHGVLRDILVGAFPETFSTHRV